MNESTTVQPRSEGWVEHACSLPVAFAQVREDPLLDLEIVNRMPDGASVIMIGSGGCTAALLAASSRVSRLVVVDPSPSQLALVKVKMHLLERYERADRSKLLGHQAMRSEERAQMTQSILRDLNLRQDAFGPVEFVAQKGLDYCGRYEILFAQLQQGIEKFAQFTDSLLRLSDPVDQANAFRSNRAFQRQLTTTMRQVMSQANLVALFGSDATRNRVQPFAQHFEQRLIESISTIPNATNPYIWQFLAGKYPPDSETPWLVSPLCLNLPDIRFVSKTIADELATSDQKFDFVHLSNVLDWLTDAEATATLRLASDSLQDGGYVFVRQLNSSLDIRSLANQIEWLESDSEKLHFADRSFFYRDLHLGRKR